MDIEMHPVAVATNILAFGYDAASATLRVVFKGYRRQKDGVVIPDRVYDYRNVEPHHYEALREAEKDPDKSVGRYFHTHLKSGYSYSQIEEPK